jgi:hypothetical protein
MNAHEIRVPGGRDMVSAIRWELFAFHDVRDVVATDRPDVLLVIHLGDPHPSEWLATLRSAGYSATAGAES